MSGHSGPFRLERELFEDESSALFAAHDERDASVCTVQVFGSLDPEAARELRVRAGQVRDETGRGWLPLRETVEIDGQQLIRFDALCGQSLSGDQSLDWADVCRWFADVCDGLQVLHRAGLLHGQLEARHVWVTPDAALLVGLAPTAPTCDAIGRRGELAAVAGLIVEALTGKAPPSMQPESLDDATLVSASVQLADEGIQVPPRLQSVLDDLLMPSTTSQLASASDVARALREVAAPEDETQAVPIPPADPLIGTTFAEFEILRVLGRGGMGVVYEARDPRLDRKLAVKRIRSEAMDANGKARFLLEARACSRISHPNVVTVYASGEENGDPYLAMELLRGRTLKQMVNAGDVGWRKAVTWTADVLGALEKLHEEKIIHRDLKTDNIMLTTDGVVKLMDFGLATMNTEVTLTAAGSTVGTVWYMSPEQASGHKVDARSDVFSMGVVLYELLSGQRPFTGEHPLAVLLAIQQKDYEPVEKLDVDLPAPIDPILRRALAKDPDERFAGAGALRRALLEYCEQNDGAAAAPTPRRQRLMPWLAGVLALILAGVGLWTQLRPGDEYDRTRATHLNEMGQDLQAQGKWTEARVQYRQAALADPTYAIVQNNLGFLAYREGAFAEADSLFSLALSLDSKYAAAHFNLATSRWDQGDRAGAEASYRAAIDADASFPGAFGNMGALLIELDRMEDAAQVLDTGLQSAPDDPQLLRHRGRVDLARGNIEAAIERWNRALAANPQDFAVHALLAQVYDDADDVTNALRHYDALASSPETEHQQRARDAKQRLAP